MLPDDTSAGAVARDEGDAETRAAKAWAANAPDVPSEWFVRPSTLHGVGHTQRVHVHAQRLTSELRWDESDTRLVLCAALWHDIGRTNDDVDPRHGADSASRALELGLIDTLAPAEADPVIFAIALHCLTDEEALDAARRWGGEHRLAEPERALRILWLLKDADALDRVRLEPWEAVDTAQMRHEQSLALLTFADELYRVCGR